MGTPENIRRFEGESACCLADNLWLGEVMDDSMEPTYPRGSVVPFRYSELAKDGDACLVGFKGGDVAFRKVESGVGAYRLSALNGDCPAEIHPAGDVQFVLPAGGVPPIRPTVQRTRAACNGWTSLAAIMEDANLTSPCYQLSNRTVSRVLHGLGFDKMRTKDGVYFRLDPGVLANLVA